MQLNSTQSECPVWWLVLGLASSSSSVVAKSCLTLATPHTVARQAPRSTGFSRQEYWSGLSFSSIT